MKKTLSSILPSRRWLLFGLFVVLLVMPHPLLRLPAAVFFLCIAPGLPLAARTGAGGTAVLAMTLALSPVIVGIVTLLLLLADVAPQLAPSIAIGVGAAVYLVTGVRFPSYNEEDRRLLWRTALVVTAVAVVVFMLPLTHTWWRVRWDSWYHAAVVNRLWTQGLPLADPFFSPLRLQYMYFYHVVLLDVAKLTNLGPFYSMIFVNAVALSSLACGFVWLTGFFTHKLAARIAALIVCLAGLNGFFYLFYPIRLARAFFGETAGRGLVGHFFSVSPPGHRTAAALLSIEGNQFMMLEKFMLGNPLVPTLGLLCVVLGLLFLAGEGRWSRWHVVPYAVAILGLPLFHVVVGGSVTLAIVAALAGTWLLRRSERRLGTLFLATVVPLALVVPYIHSVMPSDANRTVQLAVQPGRVVGLLSAILPALILAIPAIKKTPLVLRLWLLVVVIAALTVDLVTSNETKFAFLLFVPLAAIGSVTLERWLAGPWTRRLAVAYIVLATVPLNVTYFAIASRDPSRFEVTADERLIYDWIRNQAPADAIFLEGDEQIRIPVLASRDQYWGTSYYAHLWAYPTNEMDERRGLRDRVFSHTALSDEDIDIMKSLDRPFFVVCRLESEGGAAAAGKLRINDAFRKIMGTGTIEIFFLDPSHPDPAGRSI